MSPRATLVLASVALAALSAAGCGTAPAAIPAGAVPSGVIASAIPSAPGMITREQAVTIAAAQDSALFAKASVDAVLVSATDPTTLKGDTKVSGRALWIVHFSGIDYPVSLPGGASLDPSIDSTVSNAYVYIDAYTGDWLFTRFED